MNRIFFYCCVIIIGALEVRAFSDVGEEELFEGSQCETEHGQSGLCKRIRECPPRLEEALQGKRGAGALGRCGFEGMNEIVCCANEIHRKIKIRPADSACQSNRLERVNPFIYGGTAATKGEFPYMVALGYNNTDGELEDAIVYDCGGSLISPKYILTAAHCLSNINEKIPLWVRLGTINVRSEEGGQYPINDWIVHPKFRRSQNYYDIGLISLEKALKISEAIKPICLQTEPLQISSIKFSTSFMTIGFGETEKEFRSDRLLKTANLDLVTTTECNASYVDHTKLPRGVDSTIICARDIRSAAESDACHGDSGGPLVMVTGTTHTLIAVTAFGQQCSSVVPAGYTAVHAYIDWIESIVWPEIGRS